MNIYGLIKPNGEFISCKLYDHLQIFQSDPKLMSCDDVIKRQEDVNNAIRYCQVLEGKNEHPEWNNVEMLEDDLQSTIYRQAYQTGYVRVEEINGVLHFEATPDTIMKMFQRCKDMAEDYGKHFKFVPLIVK